MTRALCCTQAARLPAPQSVLLFGASGTIGRAAAARMGGDDGNNFAADGKWANSRPGRILHRPIGNVSTCLAKILRLQIVSSQLVINCLARSLQHRLQLGDIAMAFTQCFLQQRSLEICQDQMK